MQEEQQEGRHDDKNKVVVSDDEGVVPGGCVQVICFSSACGCLWCAYTATICSGIINQEACNALVAGRGESCVVRTTLNNE
jgi:hypothetical protein